MTPTVNEQEAQDFAIAWEAGNEGATTPPCCTITTFRFDILGFPKSPWNLSAARVFCQSFIPDAERSPETIKVVTKAFISRIKTLRQNYKAAQADSATRLKSARTERRNARKYLVRVHITFDKRNSSLRFVKLKLFQRRYNIARAIPHSLGRHLDILERLGVDGMSSDESDSDDLPRVRRKRVTFKVRTPRWRNPALSDWLHAFDTVAWVHRRDKGPTRGEHPRHRLHNHRTPNFSDSKKYVPGLPINAYRADWLETRLDVDFAVCPNENIYDFSHTCDITT